MLTCSALTSPENKTYRLTTLLEGHTEWIRDVSWSPSILSKSYIASASQDKTVRIWTSEPSNPTEWTSQQLEFECVLWRVSWSLSGNILAVSGGDNVHPLFDSDASRRNHVAYVLIENFSRCAGQRSEARGFQSREVIAN